MGNKSEIMDTWDSGGRWLGGFTRFPDYADRQSRIIEDKIMNDQEILKRIEKLEKNELYRRLQKRMEDDSELILKENIEELESRLEVSYAANSEMKLEIEQVCKNNKVLVDKALSASKKLNVAEKMYKYICKLDEMGYVDIRLKQVELMRQWEDINDRVDVAGESNPIEEEVYEYIAELDSLEELAIEEDDVWYNKAGIPITVDSEEKWNLLYPDQVFDDAQLTLIKQMIHDANKKVIRGPIKFYEDMEEPEWHYLIDVKILTGKQVEVIRDMIKDEIVRAFDATR